MEHLITISLVLATVSLAAGVGLDWMRREVTKKRNDYRMGQALRRGLANPEGMRPRGLQVVQWQSCESTSAQWS
jgi:hypothetical protein